jgi:broad specificity phosphatase PhoE
MDIIHRIEPIIFEIERSKIPVVIVSHRPILRCLYGYFCNRHLEEIPTLNIPFNTVIKLTPETYLCKEE